MNLAKSDNSKECMICHYWFFNHRFEWLWSWLTMLCLNISDITIITVENVDHRCIIHNISKSEAINLLKNYFFFNFLFSIYKMVDIMDAHKSLNISVGTVMKNPEMLKFAPDHLKT